MNYDIAYPAGHEYFDLNGAPARFSSGRKPEVWRGGMWESFPDIWKFLHEVQPVSEEVWRKMVKDAGATE
jgi:hypothetical protein